MRPRRIDHDGVALRQRRDRQRFGAFKDEIQLRVEHDRRASECRRQTRVQTAAVAVSGPLEKLRLVAVDFQLLQTDHAADIADGITQIGLTDLAWRQRIGIAGNGRVEFRMEFGVELVLAHLVQTDLAEDRLHRAFGLQRFREENPQSAFLAADFTGKSLAVLLFHFDQFGIRHHQHRSRKRLRAGRTARNRLHGLSAIRLPFLDRTVDHQQRNKDRDGQADHDEDFQKQAHVVLRRCGRRHCRQRLRGGDGGCVKSR